MKTQIRLLSVLTVAALLAGCGGRLERAEDHPSPDGRYIATFLLRTGDGTVSDMPEVCLHEAETKASSRGNVFRGYRSYRLKIEWTSPTNLVIRHSPDCQVDRHLTRWQDVQIKTVADASWM